MRKFHMSLIMNFLIGLRVHVSILWENLEEPIKRTIYCLTLKHTINNGIIQLINLFD